MGKATTLVPNLAESLFALMKPPKGKTKNKANSAPPDTKNARGGQIQVRYTCEKGKITIITTQNEPRFAAPRVNCPECRGVTIEGRGLMVKPMCHWEIVG